jgi:hypothetical protein
MFLVNIWAITRNMALHVFERGSLESHRWTDVVPGDLVSSPGALAWTHARLLSNEYTGIVLGHRWLLVLARLPGVAVQGYAGTSDDAELTTFAVLSRHGLLYLLQKPTRRDDG